MKLFKRVLSMLSAAAMCTVLAVNSVSKVEIVEAVGTMRDMTSQQIVSDMGLGWNLGNTFDAYTTGQTANPSYVEQMWGNPTVSKELIQAVKAEGFKTIRVPVTWMNCMDSNGKIDTAFMSRVQEVVDYCINEGLYVILNVHHDGCENGWIRQADSSYDSVAAKYKYVWEQISATFAGYSDYLVFESMNEVGFNLAGDLTLTGNPTNEDYNTLNKLNQLFVDTVRASGSNNAERHLLIAGYNTDTYMTVDNRFIVPTDSANRCIVSVHYYSPPTFCVATSGSSWGYASTWGTSAEVAAMEEDLDKLKTRFVDAGVPVIIGEYGVLTESSNGKDQSSIVTYLKTLASEALERGMCPVLWDSGNGGDMKYFNRTSKTWYSSAVGQVYADLADKYSTGVTTPVVTQPSAEDNSVTVTLQEDDEGNLYVDLTPYVGRLITGVGFTVNGDTFSGNGGVMLGMIVYSDTTTWGGAWKGVQAPFLGADCGQLTKYTFDADNEESVDPTQIMYDGQTMTFSVNWTYPSSAKDNLTLGDEVILYFSGAELVTTTTTNVLETKVAERVTAVVGTEDNEEEDIHRPTLRIDLSPYKGNKLVGVEFSFTGTHGGGNGAVSYNLVDESSETGTSWAYTPFDFTIKNDPIKVVLSDEHSEALDYDFIGINVWYEEKGLTYDNYSFSPDVVLYFEDEVVTTVPTTEPEVIETTTSTTVTELVTTTVPTVTSIIIPTMTSYVTTTQPVTTTAPTSEVVIDPSLVTQYGDVNNDGTVDVADVVAINMYLLNSTENAIDATGLANSDCAKNGVVDSSDSVLIMSFVGMIVTEENLGVG